MDNPVREKKGPKWKYMLPLVYGPAIPLVRIAFRKVRVADGRIMRGCLSSTHIARLTPAIPRTPSFPLLLHLQNAVLRTRLSIAAVGAALCHGAYLSLFDLDVDSSHEQADHR